MVESAITRSMSALCNQDHDLAVAVIKEDEQIDRMEVELEESCITFLEQVRPTGADLRFVVAVLKINVSLERIADLAENIAETIRRVDDWDGLEGFSGCREMAERAHAMLRRSLAALVQRDAALASQVIADDHVINTMRAKLEQKLAAAIDDSTAATALLRLEYVTRQLERIGDLATNIAEDVIFMIAGQIVRHPSRFDDDGDVVRDRSGRRFRRIA